MKKIVKLFMTISLLLTSLSCSKTTSTTTTGSTVSSSDTVVNNSENNVEFDKVCNEIFIDMISESYMTIINSVEDPSAYGIDTSNMDIIYSSNISDESFDKEMEDMQSYLQQIQSFDYDSLSELQQNEYDVYVQSLTDGITLASKDYRYFNQYFASINNIYESIATNLVNVNITDELSAINLVKVMESIDGYIDSALSFIDIQIEKGLFWSDIDAVLDYCNNMLDLGTNSSTIVQIQNNINDSNLDEQLKDKYIQQVITAYSDHILVAYQHIVDKFNTLDDSVCNTQGLASYENGSEYFNIMMRDSIGISDELEDIEEMVINLLNDSLSDMQSIAEKDEDAFAAAIYGSATTQFDSVDEMMEFLIDNTKEDFPSVTIDDYQIVALDDELTNNSILAYFYGLKLDQNTPMQIRYNPNTSVYDSLNFYATMAHEGAPGHMYQFVLVYDNKDINDLSKGGFSFNGLTEGYATYVQFYSLKYLLSDDITQNTIDCYVDYETLNDMLVALADIYVNGVGMNYEEFEGMFLDYFGESSCEYIYNIVANNPLTFASYYLGYAKIKQLETKAKEALGTNYSDRGFFEALLKNGFVSFDIIEKSIDQYIASK